MRTNFDVGLPIFQQIAEMIEDDILTGEYNDDDQVISTTQFAKTFQINPATAVKGVAILVNEGILYKKRGRGMYVAPGAKQIILKKRRERFYDELVQKLMDEAKKLDLTKDEILDIIHKT